MPQFYRLLICGYSTSNFDSIVSYSVTALPWEIWASDMTLADTWLLSLFLIS